MIDTSSIPTVIPSSSSSQSRQFQSRLVVVVGDDRAIVNLMDSLYRQSGLTQVELASRMGVSKQTINQYLRYRRRNPSILWLIRFANACGGQILIELP